MLHPHMGPCFSRPHQDQDIVYIGNQMHPQLAIVGFRVLVKAHGLNELILVLDIINYEGVTSNKYRGELY